MFFSCIAEHQQLNSVEITADGFVIMTSECELLTLTAPKKKGPLSSCLKRPPYAVHQRTQVVNPSLISRCAISWRQRRIISYYFRNLCKGNSPGASKTRRFSASCSHPWCRMRTAAGTWRDHKGMHQKQIFRIDHCFGLGPRRKCFNCPRTAVSQARQRTSKQGLRCWGADGLIQNVCMTRMAGTVHY